MNTKKWKCRDGTKIRIKDMGDTHLMNTIRLLERMHQAQIANGFACASMLQGEHAIDAADAAMDQMMWIESDHPLYDDLVEEMERREDLEGKSSMDETGIGSYDAGEFYK